MNDPQAGAHDDGTIYVLNVLWFKPGGAERYQDYLDATRPLVEGLGGAFLEPFTVVNALEGPVDADLVFFGRYPSQEALFAMLESPEYQAVFHLREEAVERSFTSICRRADLTEPPGPR